MSRALPIHPVTGLQALGLIGDKPVWPIAGGDGTSQNPVLTRLLDQRSEQESFIDQLLARVAEEERDLVDAERNNLTAARERITALDQQIEPLEAFEETRSAHRSQTPRPDRGGDEQRGGSQRRLGVQPREQKYGTAGEFLVDYVRTLDYPNPGRNGEHRPDSDAVQRVSAALGRAAGDVAPGVHQTTEDTPGLLPENIVGTILNDLDGARPFVASVGVKPLTTVAGKTFHRPYVSQHTQVDEQSEEKAELASRELKIDSIPFNKRTFGGWLNVSRQDIDWTDPSAWNAIVTDLQLQYGVDTEDTAAGEFAAAITQSVTVTDESSISAWVGALYEAAVMAATANGTKRATSLRMPNHIWTSVDMWASLGTVLSVHKVNNQNSAGNSSPTSFGGDILDTTRTMVPGLPAGTVIVGHKELFEFYEERIGLLQAIVPRVLGVEVAYGGYASWGSLDATGFAKLTVSAGV